MWRLRFHWQPRSRRRPSLRISWSWCTCIVAHEEQRIRDSRFGVGSAVLYSTFIACSQGCCQAHKETSRRFKHEVVHYWGKPHTPGHAETGPTESYSPAIQASTQAAVGSQLRTRRARGMKHPARMSAGECLMLVVGFELPDACHEFLLLIPGSACRCHAGDCALMGGVGGLGWHSTSYEQEFHR